VDRQILSEDNASFAYKGKAVDIKHVGRELGVRYVHEGTLQALKAHRREVVAQADVSHRDQIRFEPPQRSADHHRA
jgi:TolB-like protein